MAQKLNIDTGVKEYDINGNGLLRFNPSDPNVYERFVRAVDEVQTLEDEYAAAAEKESVTVDAMDEHGFSVTGKQALEITTEIDRKTKKILSEVFGEQNDFDQLLSGVNLMAVATNGERVITNLFAALEPIIAKGAKAHLDNKADTAVKKATANRAARRAATKKH